MFEETRVLLSENSSITCRLKRIPAEQRFQVVDPKVIEKVESSGYILTYQKPKEIESMDIIALRSEMGSANMDLSVKPIEVNPHLVSLAQRKIPVTFFRVPTNQKQKLIVFFHGGGFIGGSTKILENQCKLLAEKSGATVLSVDYRLAPETMFPGAVYDCIDIIRWIVAHAEEWNINKDKIAVVGESAGGNLALSCSLSEVGKYIKLTIPIYGAIDLSSVEDTEYWSYDKYRVISDHQKYVTTRLNRFRSLNTILQKLYVGETIDLKTSLLSPLYATDLSNLKKVVMIEAEYDFFRLSNDKFAEKLEMANVEYEVVRYQGMDHGFYDRLGYCEQTEDCIKEVAYQVRNM